MILYCVWHDRVARDTTKYRSLCPGLNSAEYEGIVEEAVLSVERDGVLKLNVGYCHPDRSFVDCESFLPPNTRVLDLCMKPVRPTRPICCIGYVLVTTHATACFSLWLTTDQASNDPRGGGYGGCGG